MNQWRRVWREGLAPQFSLGGLRALQGALLRDDVRLIQGATCFPLPFAASIADCACAIGYCGWRGDGLMSVDQIDDYFARICDAADGALGEPAASRYFLNWFDETPRSEMRRELLAEVTRTLDARLSRAA